MGRSGSFVPGPIGSKGAARSARTHGPCRVGLVCPFDLRFVSSVAHCVGRAAVIFSSHFSQTSVFVETRDRLLQRHGRRGAPSPGPGRVAPALKAQPRRTRFRAEDALPGEMGEERQLRVDHLLQGPLEQLPLAMWSCRQPDYRPTPTLTQGSRSHVTPPLPTSSGWRTTASTVSAPGSRAPQARRPVGGRLRGGWRQRTLTSSHFDFARHATGSDLEPTPYSGLEHWPRPSRYRGFPEG